MNFLVEENSQVGDVDSCARQTFRKRIMEDLILKVCYILIYIRKFRPTSVTIYCVGTGVDG